jgi:LPXTG-motif cell wall-anchored protein
MNAKTRFLTGSLASLAVASAVTLAATPAQAAEQSARACGQPAVPATYVTVVHDPVLREVPAITHDEWLWQREVTTYELEFAKVVSAASTETDWSRDLPGTTEYQWARTVIDRAAVPGTPEQGHLETVVVTPAVTETVFEYVQQQTGKTRWEHEGWNGEHAADDDGKGWLRTGNTRDDVVTPAVTADQWVVDQPAVAAVGEVSHLEYTWATSSPGAGWNGPLDTRVTGGSTESATTAGDAVPPGAGWNKTQTRTVPAMVDTIWATEAPEGYDPTGASRVHEVTTEQTDATSADAPAGDGWTQVPGSGVVVVDRPASTELSGDGWTEQAMVSPALPATEPCAESAGGSVVVAAVQTDEPTDASAAPAAGTTVLPATGSPASPVLLTAGLGALVAGGVLVRISRRRQTG